MRCCAAGLALLLCACRQVPLHVQSDQPAWLVEAVGEAHDFWSGTSPEDSRLSFKPFRMSIVDKAGMIGAVSVYAVDGLTHGNCGWTSPHAARRIIEISSLERCRLGIARTIKHELGHALRLRHLGADTLDNLMRPNGNGTALNGRQRKKAARVAKTWFGKIFLGP